MWWLTDKTIRTRADFDYPALHQRLKPILESMGGDLGFYGIYQDLIPPGYGIWQYDWVNPSDPLELPDESVDSIK